MRLSIRTSRRRRLFESDTHRHTHRERIRDKYSRRDKKEKKIKDRVHHIRNDVVPDVLFSFCPRAAARVVAHDFTA
jgi:hypothetical protein